MSECPIEADVRDPDQSAGHRRRQTGNESSEQEREWQHVDMYGVIRRSADARPGEIRKHREIGRKEERRE